MLGASNYYSGLDTITSAHLGYRILMTDESVGGAMTGLMGNWSLSRVILFCYSTGCLNLQMYNWAPAKNSVVNAGLSGSGREKCD